MESVVIRADASLDQGAGHQMRCLALAQALQELGRLPVYAAAQSLPIVEERLAAEGIAKVRISAQPGSRDDAEEIAAVARKCQATWVVADGYAFDGGFQQAIKAADLGLMMIDDVASCRHFHADFVVNQNVSAGQLDYGGRDSHTKLLLGTRYALLRRDFVRYRQEANAVPASAKNFLVTLGGGKPAAIETVVAALLESNIKGLRGRVLLSASHPLLPSLEERASVLPGSIELITDSTEIAEHMHWAHVAISAGGGTTWELAYFGLPMLLVIAADNQRPSVQRMAAIGAAENLGETSELSVKAAKAALRRIARDAGVRQELSDAARALVDGRGALRVAAQIVGVEQENAKWRETA